MEFEYKFDCLRCGNDTCYTSFLSKFDIIIPKNSCLDKCNNKI